METTYHIWYVHSLGECLRLLRAVTGKSVSEAAREIGCSISTLSLLENGKRGMSMDMLKKIADYYEVPTDALVYPSRLVMQPWRFQ